MPRYKNMERMIPTEIIRDLGDINENWFEELTESCKNILQSCSDHVKHQVHSRDRRVDLGRNEICPRAEFEQGTSETTATSHICENTDLEPSQALHITVSTSHVTKKRKPPSPSPPGLGGLGPSVANRMDNCTSGGTLSPSHEGRTRLENKSIPLNTSSDSLEHDSTGNSTSHPLQKNELTQNLNNNTVSKIISGSTPTMGSLAKGKVPLATPEPAVGESPITGMANDRRGTGQKVSALETPKFSTPKFSPWSNKGDDRNQMSVTLESSEDLDKYLARALDSDGYSRHEQEDNLTGSVGSTVILGDDPDVQSEHSLDSAISDKCFLKDLLMKTPGSIRLANLNRLKETLGIDGNQSGLSWTSSLATPAQDKDVMTCTKSVEKSSTDSQEFLQKGPVRKLFSPVGCETDSEEVMLNSTTEDTPTKTEIASENNDPLDTGRNPLLTEGLTKTVVTTNLESAHLSVTENVSKEVSDGNTHPRRTSKDQCALNIINDLIGTPPSRIALRKLPPRRRASKRYSLPAPSSILEHIMSDDSSGPPANETFGHLPHVKDSVDKTSPSVRLGPCLSDKVEKTVARGESGALDKENHIPKVNHDFEFTQLSPSSLSAICDAVSESENIARKPSVSEKGLEVNDESISGTEAQKSVSSIIEEHSSVLPGKSEENDKQKAETQVEIGSKDREPNDFLFSQISPSALDSIFSVTDVTSSLMAVGVETVKLADNFPGSRNGDKSVISDLKENKSMEPTDLNASAKGALVGNDIISGSSKICQDVAQARTTTPSSEKPRQTSSAKVRTVGLRRKPGRFLYPTSHQISSVCPRKVIKFQSVESEKKVSEECKQDQLAEPGLNTKNEILDTGFPKEPSNDAAPKLEVKAEASKGKRKTGKMIYSLGFTPLSTYQARDPCDVAERNFNAETLSPGAAAQDENNIEMKSLTLAQAPTHVSPMTAENVLSMTAENKHVEKHSVPSLPVQDDVEDIMEGMEDEFEQDFCENVCTSPLGVKNDVKRDLPNCDSSKNILTKSGAEQVELNIAPVAKSTKTIDSKPESQLKSEYSYRASVSEKENDVFVNCGNQFTKSGTSLLDSTDFVGFQSARGKKFDLKEDTFRKYAKWFDEELPENDTSAGPSKMPLKANLGAQHPFGSRAGFERETVTTASSEVIASVPKSVQIQSGKVLRDDVSTGKSAGPEKERQVVDTENDVTRVCIPRREKHVESRTQPHEKRQISKENPEHGLANTSSNKDKTAYSIQTKETESRSPFVGFQTAGGKHFKIDDKKLARFEKWFDEEEPESGKLKKDGESSKARKEIGNKGITAEVMNLSEKVATCGNSMRVQDLPLNKKQTLPSQGNTTNTIESNTPFVGFKTAGGKNLVISEMNLSKYEKWFEEDSEKKQSPHKCFDSNIISEVSMHSGNIGNVQQSGFVGFATAHGKQLKVDSALMDKFSTWFDEECPGQLSESSDIKTGPPVIDEKVLKIEEPSQKKTITKNDYKHVPKGYRPFKRPRLIKKSANIGECSLSSNKVDLTPRERVEETNAKPVPQENTAQKAHVDGIENDQKRNLGTDTYQDGSDLKAYNDPFNDSLDNLSYTQIAEATRCAEAIMEESDSQLEDPPNMSSSTRTVNCKTPSGEDITKRSNEEFTLPVLSKPNVSHDSKFNQIKGSEAGTPGLFSTASGKAISLSEGTLVKVKDLFAEDRCEDLGKAQEMIVLRNPAKTCSSPTSADTCKNQGENLTSPEEEQNIVPVVEVGSVRGKSVPLSNGYVGDAKGGTGGQVETVAPSQLDVVITREKSNSTREDSQAARCDSCCDTGRKMAAGKSDTHVEKSLLVEEEWKVPEQNMSYSMTGHNESFLKNNEGLAYRSQDQILPSSDSSILQPNSSYSFYASGNTKKGSSVVSADAIVPDQQGLRVLGGVLRDEDRNSSLKGTPDTGQKKRFLSKGSGSMLGFQTAAGKSVKISAKALHRAQNILADTQEETMPQSDIDIYEKDSLADERKNLKERLESGDGNVERTEIVGRKDGVSSKECERKKLVDQVTKTQLMPASDSSNHSKSQYLSLGSGFSGFSTASGKVATVSESALIDAEKNKLSADDSNMTKPPASREEEPNFICSPHAVTNKKSSEVTEIAPLETQSVHMAVGDVKDLKVEREKHTQVVGFVGFSTASGKTVKISEEALKTARSVMSEENLMENSSSTGKETNPTPLPQRKNTETRRDIEPQKLPISQQCEKEEKTIVQTPFLGFSTAGGKSVTVSEASLQEVQKVFSDDFDRSNLLPNKNMNKESLPAACPRGNEDDEIVSDEARDNRKTSENFNKFLGFATAGGKSVKISQNALQKARQILETDDNDKADGPGQSEPVKNTSINSKLDIFSTASGRQVSVSKEALNQVKNPASVGDGKTTVELPKFSGFSTASGSQVSVSEEALKKAKNVLADEGETSSETTHGFQTSKRATVPVCEGTLEKAKIILSDKKSNDKNVMAKISEGGRNDERHYEDDHDVMKEISESSKALLADGDETFGEEFFSNSGLKTFTPATQRSTQYGSQRSTLHSAPARQSFSRISTMKSLTSTPEMFLSDRYQSRSSAPMRPLISAPHKDVQNAKIGSNLSIHSWEGPTSYKEYSNSAADDRTWSSLTTDKTLLEANLSKPVFQSTPVKPKTDSNFITPYKKQANDHSSSFKPPVKSSNPSGSFKTPTKPTPKKRTLSEAEIQSPVPKKTRVEDGDVNESSGVAVEDDLLIHWGQEQDSMAEALSTTDFENLEKNCEEMIESSVQCPRTESTEKVGRKVKVSTDVAKARMKAKLSQAQRIRQKREAGGVKSLPGTLYNHKMKYQGINLKTAVAGLTPHLYPKQQLYCFGVREAVLSVSAANAEDFRFSSVDFYEDKVTHEAESVRVGDGAVLMWDDASTAGKEEFCNALFDMNGVDPKLTSRDWVYNHYRWIVWKLAAMEVAFPQVFGGRFLTPDKVMLQLKYRYDREVDNSQRSAVKKIFERDDTPAKVLVLCVSAVIGLPQSLTSSGIQTSKVSSGAGDGQKPAPSTAVLELTDGWYPMKAVVDVAMTRLVSKQRLRVGDKLVMYGAELVGSQEAAPPLQAPGDTMLKISTNSCRRACWNARLGYQSNPQPVPLPLSSLFADGGIVSCVDVVVTRVYPLQYMERTSEGRTVFRNDRAEQRFSRKFDSTRQRQMETIYGKVQTEFEKRAAGTGRRSSLRTGRRLSAQVISNLNTGEEIYEALQASTDQASFEAALSHKQMSLLNEHQRRKQEELHSEMQAEFRAKLDEFEEKNPKRNVTPLLKLRVAGCSNRDIDTKTNTVLTIWRPSDDVMELLSEGKRFRIYHLSAGESRGRVKGNAVTLTAQRMTRYKDVPVDDNFLDLIYEPREVTEYSELKPSLSLPYDEVDCVGLVVLASPITSFDRASGDEGQLQTIYLADADGDLVAVKAWGGTEAYGLDEVLKVNVFVAMSNLCWRPDTANRGRLPNLTITEATLVTTNPKDHHLRTAIDHLKNKIKQEVPAFVEEMKERLHSVMTNTPSALNKVQPRTTIGQEFRSLETPRTRKVPLRPTSRSVVYPRSLPRRNSIYQPQTPNDSCNADRQPGLHSKSLNGSALNSSEHISDSAPDGTIPRTGSPMSTLQTPGGADGQEETPVVSKKRALQRLKSQKLSQVADQTPVTPLYGSIPSKLRKAFKLPTMVRSASPDLVGGRTVERRLSVGSPLVSSADKLHRKLNFTEEGAAETEGSGKTIDETSQGVRLAKDNMTETFVSHSAGQDSKIMLGSDPSSNQVSRCSELNDSKCALQCEENVTSGVPQLPSEMQPSSSRRKRQRSENDSSIKSKRTPSRSCYEK